MKNNFREIEGDIMNGILPIPGKLSKVLNTAIKFYVP
jgi:hypothetical protein